MNRFLEWIALKQKLHQGTQAPPLVSAGDIWWASIGENVGSEINGKSRLFLIASLHQARAIDHRRLSTKLGQLDDTDFERVRDDLTPAKAAEVLRKQPITARDQGVKE